MEHLQVIATFWSRLPAFRAIGETGHLPTAARALGVTPSALSRTLQQLEAALGKPLFRRGNRRLELTTAGERFLAAARDAMRVVHDASVDVRDARPEGPLRIAIGGVAVSHWIVPAVAALRAAQPGLVPHFTSDFSELGPRLLSGRLDIAFQSGHFAHPRLRTELLGKVPTGVFCGPPHPLYARKRVGLDDVLAADFVAPPPGPTGGPIDGWPVEMPRRVVMEADQMRVGCEVCLAAPLLAVLPEPAAIAMGRGALRRLPIDITPPTAVFAILRKNLGRRNAPDLLLDTVREAIAARPTGGDSRARRPRR